MSTKKKRWLIQYPTVVVVIVFTIWLIQSIPSLGLAVALLAVMAVSELLLPPFGTKASPNSTGPSETSGPQQ